MSSFLFHELTDVILISIEFAEPSFSGNAVLSRSLIRGLLGHDHVHPIQVHVICGIPSPASCPEAYSRTSHFQKDVWNEMKGCWAIPMNQCGLASFDTPEGRRSFECVGIALDQWWKLNWEADMENFAPHAARVLRKMLDCQNGKGRTVVITIDWTGSEVVKMMHPSRILEAGGWMHMVFRVFTLDGIFDPSHLEFYRSRERWALETAQLSILLSSVDHHCIITHVFNATPIDCIPSHRFFVVNPPVRQDMLDAVDSDSQSTHQRIPRKPRFMTCVCRVSPEKHVRRFLNLCLMLEEDGKWGEWELCPCLCGAISDPEYAADIGLHSIQQKIKGFKHYEFLSALEMKEIFRDSIAVFHPVPIEAYALALVEAACVGTPSIVHQSDVGACDVLSLEDELAFGVSFESEDIMKEHVVNVIERIISESDEDSTQRKMHLMRVVRKKCSEDFYAIQLTKLMAKLMDG